MAVDAVDLKVGFHTYPSSRPLTAAAFQRELLEGKKDFVCLMEMERHRFASDAGFEDTCPTCFTELQHGLRLKPLSAPHTMCVKNKSKKC